MSDRSAAPTRVMGPLGEPLDLESLPSPGTVRWVIRRKAEVVAAVDGGLLSIDEVCQRYNLTLEEFAGWQRAVDRSGMPGEDFDPFAALPVLPWWTVLQTIAWITTRSAAYVAHVADLEGTALDRLDRSVAFSAILTYIARKHCKCAAKDLPDYDRVKDCICTGDAGRSLLAAIKSGTATPIQDIDGGTIKMTFHDLAGIGQRPTCIDWLELRPVPIFSSAEVMGSFPNLIDIKAINSGAATYTVPEIEAWIKAQTFNNVKTARAKFMVDSRSKGLSATFETVWGTIHKRGRGRPSNLKT